MSTDTMAWFDVPTPVDAITLRDRFSIEPALAALIARFGSHWKPTAWTLESDATVIGPGGLAIRLTRPRLASAYHVVRFSTFAAAGDETVLVRRAFHAIAHCLGTGRAVITHELAATGDGDGLDSVIAALTRNAGAPATSYRELFEAELYEPRSWIIDAFADL